MFEFRLQSVLNIRKKFENQRELEYGRAIKKLEAERERERVLEECKTTRLDALAKLIETQINPVEVLRYNEFIEDLKDKIAVQKKAVKAAEEFAEDRRQKLVEAMRERKTIERLRENAHEDYLKEEKRAEQKQADEIVSYKYSQQ